MTAAIEEPDWATIEAKVQDMVRTMHAGVEFANIWVLPRKSWCDMDMVDVWAIYDGEPEDLAPPACPSLGLRIQDMLWDMGIDAIPTTHLVTKADARDWQPEGV